MAINKRRDIALPKLISRNVPRQRELCVELELHGRSLLPTEKSSLPRFGINWEAGSASQCDGAGREAGARNLAAQLSVGPPEHGTDELSSSTTVGYWE